MLLVVFAAVASAQESRPNFLWITSEDTGPHLGCYGDAFADTPTLDALAAKGCVYRTCWSNSPVCAPSYTALLSGMHPPGTGSEHMQCYATLPEGFLMYPQYLRQAGYYCTNNRKNDNNLQTQGEVWDESGSRAHWRNRKPGTPFFATFNIGVAHEGSIRRRPHKAVHNPALVRVPAYHPDTKQVRQDWAQYYDKVTEVDAHVGRRLQQLADDGLAEDTIIIFSSDHGPGMPRSKRFPYDSGLHVPLLIYIPEKFRGLASDDYDTGGETARVVSFVDLGPTVLSLAGIKPPTHYQGHAFLGKFATEPQRYVFGFRGRMDDRYDLVRSITDGRFVYIRNYMPHLPSGQYIGYMFATPTTRVWRQMFVDGKLNQAQSHFWTSKPTEELYDLSTDRDEVSNLAGVAQHAQTLARMRTALDKWEHQIRDTGFLPEGEIHSRSKGSTPYEMARDDSKYPFEQIYRMARVASSLDEEATPQLIQALSNLDSAVRYWGAMGLWIRGKQGVADGHRALVAAMKDDSPFVRVTAARALAQFGNDDDRADSVRLMIDHADIGDGNNFVAMLAVTGLGENLDLAIQYRDRIAALPGKAPSPRPRSGGYLRGLLSKLKADLR